jgi:hypothetical protein
MEQTVTKQAVLILGMHRSGTSWLTGSLQQAGLYLAKHHSWNPHNRKGNRENPDVMALHEQILAANNGAWNAPPETIIWNHQHKQIAQQLISENTQQQRWGFKDPRTLLMLEGWKELLDDISYVGIFRHPVAVAASLFNRGGMQQQQAFSLWEHYNTILLKQYQHIAFPVLCFDWTEQNLHKALPGVCNYLSLNQRDTTIENSLFFDADLRHNSADFDIELPESVVSLYQQLTDISRNYSG